jgi:hypothetical protein
MRKPSNPLLTTYFTLVRLLVYVTVPVALLLLPAGYFDSGESICLSSVLFGIECYGCGMTRACMHLIHLEFEDAFFFNPISFVAFPILAYLRARWAYQDYRFLSRQWTVKSLSHS